jgi:MFS family permease
LLLFAATGPIVQFLPLIGRQLGFTATLIGTIYTILPISGLIAKPLFGTLADKFRLHKTFFLLFQAILAIAFFSVYFIPELDRSANIIFVCDNNIPFLEICPQNKFSKETLDAVTGTINSSAICRVSKSCNIR